MIGHESLPDVPEFASPPLQAGPVLLRPVTGADHSLLQQAELDPDLIARWRLRGSTPSPDAWWQSLWAGVLAQFLVVDIRSDRVVGLVSAHDHNARDRYATVAAARIGGDRGASPLILWGFGLFVRHLFACWDLHKLYMEVAEYNLPQFASAIGRFAEEEGRLGEHTFMAGRRWDQIILAIYRDRWEERSASVLAQLDAMPVARSADELWQEKYGPPDG